MNQFGSHQETPDTKPSPPEPTHAERARTLMEVSRVATLCTTSQKHQDWPFGSVVAYGLDHQGNPSLLISNMAMHTKNLLADPRVSVLVTPADQSGDPLGAARVTLMGQMKKIQKDNAGEIRREYLTRHHNAEYWVDFADFNFFVMDTMDIYYVGGFGSMGWVTASDYHSARVDPLAKDQTRLMNHLNTHHADTLLVMGKAWGEPTTETAVITAVDRLGFQLRLKTPDRFTSTRLAFPEAIDTPDGVEAAFLALAQEAKTGNPNT